MRYRHRITTRVNRETKAQLRNICSVTGLKESEFVRLSITTYLREASGIIISGEEDNVSDD